MLSEFHYLDFFARSVTPSVFVRLDLGGQLHDASALTNLQVIELDDDAIRKFQRIMVLRTNCRVQLVGSEPPDSRASAKKARLFCRHLSQRRLLFPVLSKPQSIVHEDKRSHGSKYLGIRDD
jgi:hypothetical protein